MKTSQIHLASTNDWTVCATCVSACPKGMSTIKLDAAQKGLSLFVLGAYDVNNSYGPAEFLSLFMNADSIYTDSFHGCVFALQFHRSLNVLHITEQEDEKDKISRILTLFENAGITHNNFQHTLNAFSDIDWGIVDENLLTKRRESIEYLKSNLI